jgi:hypothetical protein
LEEDHGVKLRHSMGLRKVYLMPKKLPSV